MAQASSFDVTTGVDLQEVDNAVNQAQKEITQRYDFKGSPAKIELQRAENKIILEAEGDYKIAAVLDVLQSKLIKRGVSVNGSRKLALGASAALMPWVMLVPQLHSVGWVIFIFSLAFFGQQSWSTLVMILPTDMISKHAVGTLAGLVGFGGAMGGVLLGQIVGWLRDHGYSYTPALVISGSMHIAAFVLICLVIPKIQPLKILTAK